MQPDSDLYLSWNKRLSTKNHKGSSPGLLSRFFQEYTLNQAFIILVEPWIQAFLGWIPGYPGFLIRSICYKAFIGRLPGLSYIAPGVTFQRSYGIHIGENFAINRGSFLDGKGGLQIGKNVLIGPYVVIATSQHSFDNPELPIIYHLEKRAAVAVGDDVWIGAHATIMPGTTIGNRVVIGAGAVVTENIEPYSVAVGVPARVIRKLNRPDLG
jgi:maltose O-acetyltransferase